ncbi:MAG TPA: phosphate/phosphite/phosphonate ABC transporter substrate-binding protein [Desulfurivibrionaceae bacterium]|nr:phosphate/phosphite/phosphonate ABC transporter substrate-binding protein [Desulfurivibrionaceae bacterium]
MPVSRLVIRFSLLFVCCLFLGCDRSPAPPSAGKLIRLDKLAPLPDYKTKQGETLRVAVAAILSPEGTVTSYNALLAHLGKLLDVPVQMVQRRTYQEINELIADGSIDLAFVCTGAYQAGAEEMTVLVVPQINGATTYRAVLLAPRESGVRSFADLRGKSFAFSDPMSNTGFAYPQSLLAAIAESTETYFSRTIFTYSHDRTISAIAEGLADAGSVDELVYRHALKRDPSLADTLMVIQQSEEFPMPPVVVPRDKDAAFVARVRRVLLGFHQDEAAKRILANLDIDRFVLPGKGYHDR